MTEKSASVTMIPRAKIWVEVDGDYVFGLGVCRILEAVEETGSIKQAAEVVGKSYRHVWSRIKEVEKRLGFSLVETQVGGATQRRSTLTTPALKLVSQYRAMRQEVFDLVDEKFSKSFQEIDSDRAGTAGTQ